MPPCSPSVTRPAARSAALALGLTFTGALPLVAPAAADVSISPTTAVQGDATSVTFSVRNQRPGAHTVKIEVDLPSDAPIAEVYPMTVPDWAPKIVTRPVKDPLPGIHGSGLTDATAAVVWYRAGDAPEPPPVETLRLEMGPLPEAPQVAFTVFQTYSDGTVQRWNGASPASAASSGAASSGAGGGTTVLTLTPDPNPGSDAAGGAGGHAHSGQAGNPQQAPVQDPTAGSAGAEAAQRIELQPAAASSRAAGNGEGGTSLLDIAAGGGLAVGVVVLVLMVARGTARKPTDIT